MIAVEKLCTKCELIQPLSEFYKRSDAQGGYRSHCKTCTKAGESVYRDKNRDHRAARNRQWYQANKEIRSEYHRDWYGKNREKKLAANAEWLAENHERKRAKDREWAARGGQKKSTEKWRLKNRERYLENARNKEAKRRALQADATVMPFTAGQLAQRWAYYGDKCWMCGDQATATDHVKPLSKGGAHMLCNLRPACKPCNSVKRDIWPYPLTNDPATAAA